MKSCRLITGKLLISAVLAWLLLPSNIVALSFQTDEATSFARCWEYPVSPDLSIAIDSDGDTVFFIDTERKLSAVELSSGTRLWSSELAGDAVSNVLVTNGVVIVASQASAGKAVLRAVSKVTGITQWSAELASASSVALGTLNGTVVALSSSGLATAFYSDRGTPSWSKEIGAAVTTAPFFHGRTLIVGTDRKEVIGISIPSGETTLVAKLDGAPTALFSLDTENILVGDDRGNLTLMSRLGKRQWKFRNGARISAITGYDSEYLATSHDNFLYKLTRGGNVEWKRRLSARIDKTPVVVDTFAILSTVGDGAVYVIDLTTGKIVNRIETADETSAQTARGKNGFAIMSPKGVAFYSRNECSGAKKTVPDVTPSREKS